MRITAGWFTPMLHVADVARSIRFYERLGFDLIDVEGDPSCPAWARMHCEGGAVMFLQAEEPFEVSARSILFIMYTEDLPAFRERLLAEGIGVSPIHHPEYMPSGEIRIEDPDGYALFANHWSSSEHEGWEASRKDRLAQWTNRSS